MVAFLSNSRQERIWAYFPKCPASVFLFLCRRVSQELHPDSSSNHQRVFLSLQMNDYIAAYHDAVLLVGQVMRNISAKNLSEIENMEYFNTKYFRNISFNGEEGGGESWREGDRKWSTMNFKGALENAHSRILYIWFYETVWTNHPGAFIGNQERHGGSNYSRSLAICSHVATKKVITT